MVVQVIHENQWSSFSDVNPLEDAVISILIPVANDVLCNEPRPRKPFSFDSTWFISRDANQALLTKTLERERTFITSERSRRKKIMHRHAGSVLLLYHIGFCLCCLE